MYLTTVFFGSFSIVLMNNNGLNLRSRVRESSRAHRDAAQQRAGGRGDPVDSDPDQRRCYSVKRDGEKTVCFFFLRKRGSPGKTDRSDDGSMQRGNHRRELGVALYSSDSLRSKREEERRSERTFSHWISQMLSFLIFLSKKNKKTNKH